jgi:hypothetical protein
MGYFEHYGRTDIVDFTPLAQNMDGKPFSSMEFSKEDSWPQSGLFAVIPGIKEARIPCPKKR